MTKRGTLRPPANLPDPLDRFEINSHERTIAAVRAGCIAPLRSVVRDGSRSSFEGVVYSTPIEVASLGWTCSVTQDDDGGWRVEIRGDAFGEDIAVEEAMPRLSMALLAACEAFVGRLRAAIDVARHELAAGAVIEAPRATRRPAVAAVP